LKPKGWVDGVRNDNHDQQGVGHEMMNPA